MFSRHAFKLASRLLILSVTLLVGACGDDRTVPADQSESTLPGVYAGTFPCQNCPGIRATLWLRPDGRYFLRQRYLEDAESDAMTSYSLGRWRWIPDDTVLELQGAGPGRTFTYPDRDTLLMRTGSDLEHRLSRQSAAPDFTSTIAMTGMMKTTGGGASFTECRTGLTAPVEGNRELTRFRQQYRRAEARGRPAYVELEGRFAWSPDGSLQSFVIERFITVKEGQSC